MSHIKDLVLEKSFSFPTLAAALAHVYGLAGDEVEVHPPFSLQTLGENNKILCEACAVKGEFSMLLTLILRADGLPDNMTEIARRLAALLDTRCLLPVLDDPNPCTVYLLQADGQLSAEYLDPARLDGDGYFLCTKDARDKP